MAGLPSPADFAPPPTAADHARWAEADRAARPARLGAAAGPVRERSRIDAYFGLRREHMRYLTGLRPRRRRGEGRRHTRASSSSGATRSSCSPIRATRSRPAARRRASRIVDAGYDLAGRWAELVASLGAKRVARRGRRSCRTRRGGGSRPPRRTSSSSRSRAGSRPIGRSRSRPSSSGSPPPARSRTGRSRRCCRRSGRARPSTTSRSSSSGCCGPAARRRSRSTRRASSVRAPRCRTARRPTRSSRPVAVVLFDFGAQVDGYRSDMTRTLFVRRADGARPRGLPARRARPRPRSIDQLDGRASTASSSCRRGRDLDAVARGVIEADGRWPAYGHGLGHGIGLATHELPVAEPRPRPTRRCRRRRSSGRARDLPRGRDGRPDRGPRPASTPAPGGSSA